MSEAPMTSPDIPTPETDAEWNKLLADYTFTSYSGPFRSPDSDTNWIPIARELRDFASKLEHRLAAATARAEEAERERDEAIATFDAIDYYRLKVAEAGYRGSFGFEAFVADPGGHYQEERQRVVGHGPSPMQALRNGLKTLGSTQTKTIQLRSEMRKERDNLRAELDRLRKEREESDAAAEAQLAEADEQFRTMANAHYQTRKELLRMNTRQFHHKDGINAERLDDGSVELTQNGTRIVIDADSWTSLVAAVSKNGGNSETYQAAQALHTGP